jgi:hypothetical protein
MRDLIVGLLKITIWIVAFHFMLVGAILKEKKLLLTILGIVFIPFLFIYWTVRELFRSI